MSHSLNWSDDRIATLSRLWRDGLSASQIAKSLGGVTRNAVIGKIHRLGLSGRGTSSIRSRKPRLAAPQPRASARAPALARPSLPSAQPTPTLAASPDAPGLIDNLVHLGAHACKWPIGDPKSPSFSFCGRPSDGRYCGAHARVGVRPGAAWRPDRDPVVKRALAGLV
jgi:GcrA cell cycle regulator